MRQHWRHFKAVRRSTVANYAELKQINSQQVKLLPNNFTILVWNIFKRANTHDFDKDIKKLIGRADLLCLQEVLADEHPYLCDHSRALNYHYAVSYRREDKRFEGVMNATDFKLTEHAWSVKSIGREPLTKTAKTALISLIEMQGGQPLLLINIHMLLFKYKRLMQMEIEKVMRSCEDYDDFPAIFCGDFNTFTPWQLRFLDKLLNQKGFSRAKPKQRPKGKLYLDHIYTRGISAESVEILDSIKSSDHYPLLCDLRLKGL